ncbi:MAG: M1 family metallopeptidase [Deltaproteobacteria bacterium]|nr:M1 family metallopeptidase [Deltaproteobacteria bacterium]
MADTRSYGSLTVEEQTYKLPTNVRPDRYQLQLTPDLTAFTFAGEETVSIQVLEPTTEIILNAAELQIHSVAVVAQHGQTITGAATLDEINERAIFTFPEPLVPGPYQLQLTFAGILNDKLHGFYRSTYKDANGQDKILASTQFESTDARRAFPCWDEPAYKAVFQTTLVIPEHLTAISNTAIVRETRLPGTGTKAVVFADTMKMSTYLVAFIVGEFEGTEPVYIGQTPLRVWSVPGKYYLAQFAQEVGAASLQFFSDYYNYPYPGDKLDLIAIPDFAAGAMENLGAITFRETALLVDEQAAARRELEGVANVVSHENAHMWFGDLVTMRWWNGLWLNEAFATFMATLAVDHYKPDWQRWTSFAVSRASALLVDGLHSTRPIEFPVHRPEEAAGMFDVLTYQKGAAVLRMLEQYLGAEAFRAGINLYLKKHEFANTETTDLWDAIEASSRQPARALMDTWVFQSGYPLLRVRTEGNEVVISQHIFRYLQDGQDGNDLERRWQVPIFLRASVANGVHSQTALLTGDETRLTLPSRPDWVVVNSGGHGFYRVHYTEELLDRLTAKLYDTLSAVERFNLVNDTWAAAQAGLAPMTTYLDLLRLFRDETDPNVWNIILGSGQYLYHLLDTQQRPALQTFLRSLLTPSVQKLGWSPQVGEHELISQLRGELLSALGTLGDDKTIQAEARTRYAQYQQNPAAVDRNVVPALVSILAGSGGAAEYEEFTTNFKTAKTPQEETRYLFALATFRPADLFERTLQLTINGEVRTQNAPYLMRSILLNTERRERAWAFLKANWDEMCRQYPDNSIVRMCEGILSLVTSELEADVIDFFASHPVKQGAKTMQQHLEKLRIAVAGKQRDAVNIEAYLARVA